MSKVLSVLISINVQAELDINLGGQGMVITNQGVAIQPCFQQVKYMHFCKTGQQIMFIKLGQNMHQRMGLNLPFSKPSRKSCSRYCPSVRGRGTGPRSLAHSTARQRILPRSHCHLRLTQASTQSRKRNKDFIVELELKTIKI